MHAHTVDCNLGTCGVEVLIFQFAHVTTVHGICPFTSETLHVEVVGTHANLLVGIESHTNITMLDFLVVAQIAHRLYNLGNARLVVSTQEGMAVSHDKVLAYVVEQFRELLRR